MYLQASNDYFALAFPWDMATTMLRAALSSSDTHKQNFLAAIIGIISIILLFVLCVVAIVLYTPVLLTGYVVAMLWVRCAIQVQYSAPAPPAPKYCELLQSAQDQAVAAVSARISDTGPGVQWTDPEYTASVEGYLYRNEASVEAEDQVKVDTFQRLTSPNCRYGPTQRTPSEGVVLSMGQCESEMCRNMLQGGFGTCYFLSVLQCQALMLAGFYDPPQIVLHCDMVKSIFACRFWYLGKWEVVLVDDFVPCYHSQKSPGMEAAIGAECRDGVSIFLPIVEKAYGKLHDRALNIWGGQARYAAVDVLGGVGFSCTNLQIREAMSSLTTAFCVCF